MSTEQIVREAMALPPEERAKVAEQLLSSLETPEQREIEAAWEVEIERRIDVYESGSVKARRADQVIREMRERLRKA